MGLSYDEATWSVPYAVILQLCHCEMSRNNVEAFWAKGNGDTVADMTATKERDFNFQWQ